MAKDPRTRPAELADDQPETADDLATAEAKSRSVDERIPEHYGVDRARGIDQPAPAAHVPQAGVAVPGSVDDRGPGEAVLEKERQHRTTPRRSG